MLDRRLLATALVLTLSASLGSAAIIIADLTDPDDSYTIAEVIAAKGIQVGDKLFDEFVVTPSGTATAVSPGADAIVVTGNQTLPGDYGLRFNGGWGAGGGQEADTTIKFRVSIIEPFLSQGWVIEDNELWITAKGVSQTLNGGIVSISEDVYLTDPADGPVDPIANKHVFYATPTDQKLSDHAYFMQGGQPVVATEIWVVKDVYVSGGLGETGVAHLSEFYQSFSQVPEPATVVVLLVGGAGLLFSRHRRRRR